MRRQSGLPIDLEQILAKVGAHLERGESIAADLPAKVTYNDHVLPIFRNACLNCHNPDKKKAGLDLSSYGGVMAGSENGSLKTIAELEGFQCDDGQFAFWRGECEFASPYVTAWIVRVLHAAYCGVKTAAPGTPVGWAPAPAPDCTLSCWLRMAAASGVWLGLYSSAVDST